MSSRDLLRKMIDAAAEAGHVMKLEYREPPAGVKGPTKYWLRCSCGYESRARRSSSAALSTVAWHAGNVAGESDRVKNGGAPAQAPTPRVSVTAGGTEVVVGSPQK